MKTHSRKILLLALAVLTAAAGARPRIETIRQPASPEVVVCLQNTYNVTLPVLELARKTAARIFASIDVPVTWRDRPDCPASIGGLFIVAQIEPQVPESVHPGALAYALPYELAGIRIHVFAERMPHLGERGSNGVFLGHVIAHEIGHILEGINCHSRAGVMKARWDGRDISRMLFSSLDFSPEDVQLIHTGIEKTLRRGADTFEPLAEWTSPASTRK